jgi:hypothetical protein
MNDPDALTRTARYDRKKADQRDRTTTDEYPADRATAPLRGRCMARPRAGLLRSIQRSEGSRVNGSGLIGPTVSSTCTTSSTRAAFPLMFSEPVTELDSTRTQAGELQL